MDLTAGVSNVLLTSGLLPSDSQSTEVQHRSSNPSVTKYAMNDSTDTIDETSTSLSSCLDKHSTQDLPLVHPSPALSEKLVKRTFFINTPTDKRKDDLATEKPRSNIRKGVSEPNLAKASRSKSPVSALFSPRHILDRFKRFLPQSSSKQSLNEKNSRVDDPRSVRTTNDSDDSASISSESNVQSRTSRLDHVNRVRNAYDTIGTSSQISSLMIDPYQTTSARQLDGLYSYIVHIQPEQDLGYFSHGNGCLLSSNIEHGHVSNRTPIRFKYPPDAADEVTLKYFCFPDQHDANNNPIVLNKKLTQEYFRFTLTNIHGERQYGYCSRFSHKGVLNALCLVSPYDMIELYEKILSTATELFISYKDNQARQFLEEIYPHRLPNHGDTIHIDTTTIGLYTLKCEYDRRKQLIDSTGLLNLSTGKNKYFFRRLFVRIRVIINIVHG
jgi:hypothetical protein